MDDYINDISVYIYTSTEKSLVLTRINAKEDGYLDIFLISNSPRHLLIQLRL